MEASEFRNMSDQELGVKLQELEEELFRLRLRRGTNQLDSPAQMKKTRRDIARALTVQQERAKEIRR